MYEIICKLAETSSILEKKEILQKNKNNDQLRKYFYYALNDTKYGVKATEYNRTKPLTEHKSDYNSVFEAVDTFVKRKTDIKLRMQEYRNVFNDDEWNVFCNILKKDPNCGVSVAIANDLWYIVPKKVMLCKGEPYSTKLVEEYIKFPCYVQTKADGARCLCFVEVAENSYYVKLLSSSGKLYHGINSIGFHIIDNSIPVVSDLSEYKNGFVLDGELLVREQGRIMKDMNGELLPDPLSAILPRKEGNGILNKSIKNTISKEEGSRVFMVAWDIIPIDDYNNNVCEIPYSERLKTLETICGGNDPYIKIIKTDVANDTDDIKKHFYERLKNNEEGVMIKNEDFIWRGKRLHEQLKLKLELTSTLEVTGIEYGQAGTKYKDVVGCLHCQSSDGKVKVDVGSGLSDVDRYNFALDVPKFIEVKSNGLITTSTGEYSLFLPRFVEERLDKMKADDYDTILKTQESTMGKL